MVKVFYIISNLIYKLGLRRISKILDRIFAILTTSFVPGSATIEKGTKFAYGGLCVVIHSNTKIGKDVMIGQGVTLGAKEGFSSSGKNLAPKIGNNCYLAAGSKILGNIEIGHSSIIGCNAVVIHSFPPHSILGGIPAKLIGKTDENYKALR